jgi:hypothetical protein
MTLKQLQGYARAYLSGSLSEDSFHEVILTYLADATPDDYAAFAMWLAEQKEVH